MVSKIFTVDTVGPGYQASLANGEVVFVGTGVTVASNNGSAIFGSGGSMYANIQGSVVAVSTGIYFGQAANSTNRILVGTDGYVGGFNAGISMQSSLGSIDNRGSIWGGRTGIEINGASGTPGISTRITNSGKIEGDNYAISNLGVDNIYLTNSGTISSTNWAYYGEYTTAQDYITNTGKIIGSVNLGKGNDKYDGATGLLSGQDGNRGMVNGGEGEDRIYGGKNAETLFGGSEHDTIEGGGGDDYIDGGAGEDSLKGDAGNDSLYGYADTDYIDGGTGADQMYGGAGSDLYVVDNINDRVLELAAEGTDALYATVSYTLGFDQEIEQFAFFDLTNSGKGAKLVGNNLAQIIAGGGGNDTIDGGGGKDTLQGSSGNDTYVTDGGDTIIEASDGGTDLVKSSATHTLSANVENLTLTGSGVISGTGNGLANILTGNGAKNSLSGAAGKDTLSGGAGDDTLNGGVGLDKLTGGNGKDTFYFNTAPGGGNIDTITDFKMADDTISLQNSVFKAFVKEGALAASAFAVNLTGKAGDASDKIIYEKDTGKLFYDADGTGPGASVQFALISKDLALTAADFIIV